MTKVLYNIEALERLVRQRIIRYFVDMDKVVDKIFTISLVTSDGDKFFFYADYDHSLGIDAKLNRSS